MLNNYEPKDVLHWFSEIAKIPHCSKHEQQLSDYIMAFAKERGLEAHQLEHWVTIVKKPATAGYEHHKPIILQGHIDMVCEKNPGVEHDFMKDPLKLKVEDDWLKAEGTTLGADDGMAVAYMLAILDSKDIPHPALDCLFTTQEELSMDGAMSVTGDYLDGAYLFNIDGEVEKELLVGCAGGLTLYTTLPIEKEKAQDPGYCLELSHFMGGHSGQEIEKSRANAIKFLVRVLHADPELRLASIGGGSKHNAIPTTAKACFTTPDIQKVKAKLAQLIANYKVTDPDIQYTLEAAEVSEVYTDEAHRRALGFLIAIPDGVTYMDPVFPGLVMTSLSNGVLIEEGKELKLTTLLRSSNKEAEVEIHDRFKAIVKALGGTLTDDGGYPAWEHDPDAELEKIAVDVYEKVLGVKPEVKTIHCGLECGILKRPLPKVQMLTFGPDILEVHTTRERAHLPSIERIYRFLKELIISLP